MNEEIFHVKEKKSDIFFKIIVIISCITIIVVTIIVT